MSIEMKIVIAVSQKNTHTRTYVLCDVQAC
jgi:hypothetical protein